LAQKLFSLEKKKADPGDCKWMDLVQNCIWRQASVLAELNAYWNAETWHEHRILVAKIIWKKATWNTWEMGNRTTFCCFYLVKEPLMEVC
jgi:hypothetical protein